MSNMRSDMKIIHKIRTERFLKCFFFLALFQYIKGTTAIGSQIWSKQLK